MLISNFFKKALKNFENREFVFFDAKFENEDLVFENLFVSFNKNSNVLIIFGENCSGKSFFSNIIEVLAKDNKISCRSVSMKNRTKSGVEKAIVVGHESIQSTGETSVSFAQKSLLNTLKSENSAIAILDEPDIGLSSYYLKAFGEYIASISNQFNDDKGLILITHSRELLNSFLKNNKNNYSQIGINTKCEIKDWINKNDKASVEELLNLSKKSIEIFRAIHKSIS